ncbi:hypothetical protein MNV49_007469 [Pseudohyphozyma bogoriensis]|nr:hypothetical protein MNV49_007469 [Pseudohyphozyma bogoriensis]
MIALPDDILVNVFDQVPHDHHNTLATCTLVCRQWYRTAGQRLYHSVPLYVDTPYLQKQRSTVALVNTISSNPTCASAVRLVTLRSQHTQVARFNETAAQALSKLPGATTLTLQFTETADILPPSQPVVSALSTIHTFRIDQDGDNARLNVASLVKWIQAADALKHVHLRSSTTDHYEAPSGWPSSCGSRNSMNLASDVY